MKNVLDFFLNKNIISVERLYLIERDNEEYLQEDTYILTTENNEKIQLIITDNELDFFILTSLNEVRYQGSFTPLEFICKDIELIKSEQIKKINSYRVKKSGYVFCSCFLKNNDEFVFGFAYGFDELSLIISQEKFQQVLNYYRGDSSFEVELI